ncbi:Choline ABC transporter, periplasmic binding protein [Enterobacter sp. FY-07]|uniref:choline ABC transporter substrate-binding protein n=1 Tax=Kosakonia oryzendophytica TaxID=1005665 RepID=UPI000777079E|nr:choline ABC transporter substrate-binding protein [Kosakonia oryzendophytica]AMO47888.1 Choline ABC transporter, periplasmic binding protein [Enterobacter sp. FY-07]WBT59572.1 choline ABC transporter substrate-binding protein [Kosakonia oryzendophytica]
MNNTVSKLVLLALAGGFSLSSIAADDARCATITQADPGWTDIAATNALSGVVLNALGYQQKVQNLSVALAFQGLKTGQVDVFLGNWMPAQEPVISKFTADGAIKVVGANLPAARFTLAVPDYVAAAGVKDFADLQKYAAKFNHTIYGIAPGAPANQNLKKMIEKQDFGLQNWQLVESSESGMLAQVTRAVERKAWIVFLGWEPHAMNTHFKLAYLSGGDAYFGANYGSATVNTVTRNDFARDCPNAGRFFSQLKFDVAIENAVIGRVLDKQETAQAAAKAELAKRPELLKSWLNGVTTRDGQPGQAAVEKALGL